MRTGVRLSLRFLKQNLTSIAAIVVEDTIVVGLLLPKGLPRSALT